ncbi:CDI toxin immunity protein [Geobacillus sp. Geo 8.1]
MTLFEECVYAIGHENLRILTSGETETYFDYLCTLFPILPWGRIDWEKVSEKKNIKHASEVVDWLRQRGIDHHDVIVLWNYSNNPGIQTTLERVLHAIDDVVAVGSDTFILCQHGEYAIECFHDGVVTIGVPEKKRHFHAGEKGESNDHCQQL